MGSVDQLTPHGNLEQRGPAASQAMSWPALLLGRCFRPSRCFSGYGIGFTLGSCTPPESGLVLLLKCSSGRYWKHLIFWHLLMECLGTGGESGGGVHSTQVHGQGKALSTSLGSEGEVGTLCSWGH